MNTNKTESILSDNTSVHGGIYHNGTVLMNWNGKSDTITLDGDFTADELIEIAQFMKQKS